ncbi:MAG: hypothetical protein FWD02_03710 [Bacteroidales bacterium]|nr:hypothetical protein [Bacteroidales bacterium]
MEQPNSKEMSRSARHDGVRNGEEEKMERFHRSIFSSALSKRSSFRAVSEESICYLPFGCAAAGQKIIQQQLQL